jgi:hypothetical protein
VSTHLCHALERIVAPHFCPVCGTQTHGSFLKVESKKLCNNRTIQLELGLTKGRKNDSFFLPFVKLSVVIDFYLSRFF